MVALVVGQLTAGLKYQVPDDATLQKVKSAIAKDAPSIKGDDLAVRQVVKGKIQNQPVAIGVAIDAHNEGEADDERRGVDRGARVPAV